MVCFFSSHISVTLCKRTSSLKCEQSNLSWQTTSWMVQESQFPSRARSSEPVLFCGASVPRMCILSVPRGKATYLLPSCPFPWLMALQTTCCTQQSFGVIIRICTPFFSWEYLALLPSSLWWWDLWRLLGCTSSGPHHCGGQFCVCHWISSMNLWVGLLKTEMDRLFQENEFELPWGLTT